MIFGNNGIKNSRKHLIGFCIPGIDADGAVRVFDPGSDGLFKGKPGTCPKMTQTFINRLGQVLFYKGRGGFGKKTCRQNASTLIGRCLGRNSPGQQGLNFVQNHALGMAYGKLRSVFAGQAGAFGQIPDFKIKFISVYNCFHNIPLLSDMSAYISI